MPAQILRDYQKRGLAEILGAYKSGARSVLAVAPTGSGKTTLFTSLAADVPSTLILVHRRELATQAANRLREFGADFGFIMAGEQPKPYARIQIASVQTLVRRRAPRAALVVCDEAHLSTAATWQAVLDQYPNSRILGVTATPWRLSGKPLIGLYDRCVIIARPRELREAGHLCPYVGFSYKTPDLSSVRTTGGDYNEKQSAAAMSDSLIVDNVVEEYAAHARDLSAVVFAVTVEHSLQLTAKFRAAGISAEHLDGSTSKDRRDAILRRVEQGRTMVLCNVGVAVEGLDIPRLKCCILARPTKSLARAIQMMGRVRRPWNGTTARIHDHAFVIKAHGLPDEDRDYALNAKPERPPSLTQCEECFALYSGPGCPACSHVNAPKPAGERELNTVPDAEKIEFESGKEELVERREKPTPVRWTTPGRVVEGQFLGTRSERTDWGTQRRYLIRTSRRDYDLPGTTRLDALMRQVVSNARIRVTFLGDTPLAGGKHRKEFKVEVDDEIDPVEAARKLIADWKQGNR